jgi:hypothetical protein
MAWIKRNLVLVISGVIALGFLAYGGWFFYSAVQRNKDIDTEIEQTKRDIESFLSKPVTPNATNLVLVKKEMDRLNQFIAESKKLFPATPAPTEPLNALSFKSLLETTINDLYRDSRSVGILLPTNYYFSFEAQRLPVTFPAETLLPLRERLYEVQMLSKMLIDARVNRLEAIRRAPVPGERPVGASVGDNDYVKYNSRVNAETGMSLWPYELVFQCFSSELATVIDSLQKAKYGFVIQGFNSEPVVIPASAVKNTNAPPRGAMETVLNERLLRVTLQLEVIKPGPPSR